MKKIILLLAVVVIAVGASFYYWQSNRNNKLNEVKNTTNNIFPQKDRHSLFFAKKNSNLIEAYFYNFDSGDFKTFSFNPVDNINGTSWGGRNNSVQYDNLNENIFYLTNGTSEMGPCINSDDTCYNRIYKISIHKNKPEVIFQSEDTINGWLLNKHTNSIILSTYNPQTHAQNLNEINIVKGKLLKSITINHSKYVDIEHLTLTNDGLYINQAYTKSEKTNSITKPYKTSLMLNRYNTKNKELNTIDIYSVDASPNTSVWLGDGKISANGLYYAFYSKLGNQNYELLIYNLNSKTIQNTSNQIIENINLVWSPDNTRIIYNNNTFFNINDNTHKKLKPLGNGFVYSWSPFDYILFSQGNYRPVEIYSLKEDKIIKNDSLKFLDEKYSSKILSVEWY